jgi:hypothetical protein
MYTYIAIEKFILLLSYPAQELMKKCHYNQTSGIQPQRPSRVDKEVCEIVIKCYKSYPGVMQ